MGFFNGVHGVQNPKIATPHNSSGFFTGLHGNNNVELSKRRSGVVPGAVLEVLGCLANKGTGPGINSPMTMTWYDSSQNGNSLELSAGNWEGTPNNGWTGDGSFLNPYCLISNNQNYNATYSTNSNTVPYNLSTLNNFPCTIDIWVCAYGFPAINASLINFPNGTIYSSPSYQGYTLIYSYNGGQDYPPISSANINPNIWNNILLIITPNGVSVYYNDIETINISLAPAIETNDVLQLLNNYYNSPNRGISSLRIYPFAFTPEQVTQNFNAGPNAGSCTS